MKNDNTWYLIGCFVSVFFLGVAAGAIIEKIIN